MGLEALAVWVGLNIFLTLMLALNVTRIRVKLGVGIGSGESEQLDRAIRAHGNNIEYTPLALLALAMLASTGLSNVFIHILGGGLLLGRISHAVGIQKTETALPLPRVIGNVLTWGIFFSVALLLVVRGVGSL